MKPSPASLWRVVDARVQSALRRVGRPVRGVLTSVSATTRALAVQLEARAGEVVSSEAAQHYGFASVPPAGTEAIAVAIGNTSGHLVVVAELDRPNRPTDLMAGEVALYTASGASVRLLVDGSIEVSPASGQPLVLNGATILMAGGGAGVARLGDSVSPDAGFTAWLSAAATALQALSGVPLPSSVGGTITTASSVVETA